jgi:hypothetical protein
LEPWRLYVAMEESLTRHADEQATVELGAHLVIPYLPRQRVARAALAGLRRGGLVSAPLARGVAAHRRARADMEGRLSR